MVEGKLRTGNSRQNDLLKTTLRFQSRFPSDRKKNTQTDL